MIVAVDDTNLLLAAKVHSIAWQESHRSFCTPDFVESHTPQRQYDYFRRKIFGGSRIYMIVEDEPIGIVSVSGSLIEDLYVLPDRQNMGYGTRLLQYAIEKCTDTPTLWLLKPNMDAQRLYRRIGFRPTGRVRSTPGGIDEVEFALVSYRTKTQR